MSSIMWLYQTQGLISIYAPVTDVTCYSSEEEDTSAGYKKFDKMSVYLHL